MVMDGRRIAVSGREESSSITKGLNELAGGLLRALTSVKGNYVIRSSCILSFTGGG